MLLEYNQMAPLLDDPVEHPNAVRLMRKSNDRREQSAFMRKLHEDIGNVPEDGDVIACIADRDWETYLREDLVCELESIAANSLYAPPLHVISEGSFKGLTLYSGPEALVAVTTVDRADFIHSKVGSGTTQRSVTFSGLDGYIRFIKSGGLTITRWHSPLVGANTELGAHLTCHKGETTKVRDGDEIRMAGGTETIIFDSCDTSFTMLQISRRKPRAPVVPEYEVSTQRLIACSAADQKSSRLQMLSSLVRLLDGPASPALHDRLSRHEDHFVRWHTMREWLSSKPADARLRLEEMAADDPNPQVRQVAAMTAKMLFSPEKEEV